MTVRGQILENNDVALYQFIVKRKEVQIIVSINLDT